ncbi:FAD-dependent oxidoreductase [Rhizobium sp.]|uniref:FAD-dependent oxidoreductase n=1 Tax=Rhizobium sp. TaxID=391 RepID=UPI000E89F80D|nr:hypothetical protein [Rhizobium sp.]
MGESVFNIFVIGVSINGYGIARGAVGRGYLVALAEMNDFASGTSSGSTKLIHGGLSYIEHFEFRLVREALMEREVLWEMVQHISWPICFALHIKKEAAERPLKSFLRKAFEYPHGWVDVSEQSARRQFSGNRL